MSTRRPISHTEIKIGTRIADAICGAVNSNGCDGGGCVRGMVGKDLTGADGGNKGDGRLCAWIERVISGAFTSEGASDYHRTHILCNIVGQHLRRG